MTLGGARAPMCARILKMLVAIVAQLVRASVCGTGGRGFKSRRSPHSFYRRSGPYPPNDSPWGFPDFDAHEVVHFVTDRRRGLKAIIAVHSTHLGPAAGGARFWHYADAADALTDALRLSRGMSYKNAMAGLPLGGGKAVILADEARTKTPEMLHAFGKAVDGLCGRYVTAEDVGMSVADMVEFAGRPSSSPASGRGRRGRRRSGAAHLARRVPRHQGGGEARARQGQPRRAAHRDAGRGQRRHRRRAARRGRRRAAVDRRRRSGPRPQELAEATGGKVVGDRRDHDARGRRAQPQRARRDPRRGERSRRCACRSSPAAPTTSSRRSEDGERIHARGILYAPDYVINAGGIINVSHRISERRRPGHGPGAESRRFRASSRRSGRRAPPPVATRRGWRGIWRGG